MTTSDAGHKEKAKPGARTLLMMPDNPPRFYSEMRHKFPENVIMYISPEVRMGRSASRCAEQCVRQMLSSAVPASVMLARKLRLISAASRRCGEKGERAQGNLSSRGSHWQEGWGWNACHRYMWEQLRACFQPHSLSTFAVTMLMAAAHASKMVFSLRCGAGR